MYKIINLLVCAFLLSSCSFGQQPKNLEECHAYFDKDLPAKDVAYIKSLTVDQLSELHFTLGLTIRNNWIRGNRNPQLVSYFHAMGVFHPDDISGIIIRSYWSYLNKKEFDLNGEIKAYEEYWKKAAETEKQNEERVSSNETKLLNSLMDLSYKQIDAPVLALPPRKTGNQVFSDEFIKYKNGYIINSMTTYPDGWEKPGISFKYHYLDLKTNRLFRLTFGELDTVHSVIAMDSALYIAGVKNHTLKVLKHKNNTTQALHPAGSDKNRETLNNNSWIKLGSYEGKLFALQTSGLYVFDGGTWQVVTKFDLVEYFDKHHHHSEPIIPTENIQLTGQKLYFLQEILQGRDCELFELNLRTNTLSEFWQKHGLLDNYKKEINGYSFTGKDTLLVAAQRLGKTLLLSEQNNILSLYLLEDKVKTDSTGSFKIIVRKAIKTNGKLILLADNGLFEMRNGDIWPLAFFENTAQLIKDGNYKIHFNFKPRSCAVLDENTYLIGGQYGGLYLMDVEQRTILSLDDNKTTATMDLFKN